MVAIAENVVDHPELVNGYLNKDFDQKTKDVNTYFDNQASRVTGPDSAQKVNAIMKQKSDSIGNMVIQYSRNSRLQVDSLLRTLKGTGLPIGWSKTTFKQDLCGKNTGDTIFKWLLAILGWLITAGCISMGAPFWFDMLAKLVNVRRSGAKPAEAAK